MAKTVLLFFVAGIACVAACSGAKPLPKGPPPEYEDEPALSATPPATSAAPAASAPVPAASDAGHD